MLISRRDLLRRLGRGAVVSAALPAALPWMHEAAWAGTTPASSAQQDPIRLDSNENAYGPSERAKAAMRESLGVPDRGREAGHALTAEIAALHRVKPEQVVLGCGSVGIMRTAAATLLGPRRKLVLASPTFDPIAEYARSVGADVVTVPLTRQYAHDLDAMLARLDASGGLVYICNPNNPTGTLTPRHELETFIRRLPSTARVLIDEAYHHYAGTSSAYASFIDRPVDDRRVIVTRSLSKVHGLSGLRLGYAIAAPEAARRLRAAEPPMDVGAGALRGATEALHDRGHVRLSVQRNANDRQEFYNQANARMLRIIDSHANFVMLNTDGPAEQAVVLLRASNILIPPPIPSMTKYIRVSLRTPSEMLAFWRVWELMPRRTHMH
jgi:histidinol-phosphate aminotransferase